MTNLETARRDAVARLCLAQASGLLSVEAFGERYSLVGEATSVATLEALVADLELEETAPLPVTMSIAGSDRSRVGKSTFSGRGVFFTLLPA